MTVLFYLFGCSDTQIGRHTEPRVFVKTIIQLKLQILRWSIGMLIQGFDAYFIRQLEFSPK